MGNIILGLLLAALAAWAVRHIVRKARRGGGCCGEHEKAEVKIKAADRHKAHYPYEVMMDIGGMTCENCAQRVENALNRLEGIWAEVGIDSRKARVRCKTAPDEAALRGAVRSAGYVVTGYTSK